MKKIMHKDGPAAATIEELRKVGIVPTIKINGKHPKICWSVFGRPRFVSVSVTPSGPYAANVARRLVRRLIRQDGLSGHERN